MKNEFLKTLWMLRFEKIKKNEDDAAWKYQSILDQCLLEFGPDHEVNKLLALLVREERGHSKMAEELIKICFNSHPECQALQA